jgi:phage terminase small subunit
MEQRVRAFAEAFLKTQSATEAAKISGIRGRSPRSACTFLRRPDVQKIINDEMTMRARSVGVTAERVINELSALAFTSMTDFATWDGRTVSLTDSSALTRRQARAVQSVSSKMSAQGVPNVTIKLYDKTKALELLARYLGIISPDSDGSKRPQAQELAVRIRAMIREADEATGGEKGKPPARRRNGEGEAKKGKAKGKK